MLKAVFFALRPRFVRACFARALLVSLDYITRDDSDGYWSTGVLEYWSTGVLEYWSTGVLEYWSTGVLEYWSLILKFTIMAIINSAGIGKSRKSQGNLTYKYVRGRTIASSRITENRSNTPKQFLQRSRFAVFSAVCQKLSFYIEKTYDKSKYGSARNAFMRLNKSMLLPLDGLTLDDIRSESTAKTMLRLIDNLSDSTPHGLQFNSVGPIGANFVQAATQPTGVTVLDRCYGLGNIEVQGQWVLNPDQGVNNGYTATVWIAYTNSSGSAVLTTGEIAEAEYNDDTNITTFAISPTPLDSVISSADADTHIFVWISLLCGGRIVQIARPIAFVKTA